MGRDRGTNLWKCAWKKEMKDVRVSFYIKDEDAESPVGHQ